MVMSDWKKNVNTKDKLSFESNKTEDEVFIVPENFNRPNGEWELHRPITVGGIDKTSIINYQNKTNARKALMAFMRSH